MNLKQIRQAIFDMADWSPVQSADAKDRADRFVNRVLQQLVYKHPRLFEREVSLYTQADVQSDPDVVLDRLTAVLDGTLAWVMRLETPASTMVTPWETDGSWEGRQLEYQDADGVWHSNVIREVWLSVKDDAYCLSLVRPIETTAHSEYIIWSPYVVLPADVVNIKRPRLMNTLGHTPLMFEDRGMASPMDLTQLFDLREYVDPVGTPSLVTPGPRLFLPGPENKPAVELYAQAPVWLGPSPAGQFEYCLTYTWGRRDKDTRTNLGFREPLYESPPGPVSDKITVVYGGPAVELMLPTIDWMLDFFNSFGGGPVYNKEYRSGIRVRIWRRRYTATTVAPAPIDPDNVTVTHGWCLIAEVDGDAASWVDDGAILEDRTRRLKRSESYDTLCLSPRPSERSEVRVDATIRPQPLESDADTPTLPEEGMALLINRAAHLLFQSVNEKTWANTALALAQEDEGDLVKHRGRLSSTRRQRRLTRGGLVKIQ